jgi:glycosyltransferase involved in cell wall biosynthesis
MLHRYKMILTASEHMRLEYVHNGFSENTVRKVRLPVGSVSVPVSVDGAGSKAPTALADARPDSPARLLFVGRMTRVKGGREFLDALPIVSARLSRPLLVSFAGDGPERLELETKARGLMASSRDIRIEFTGWAERSRLTALFAASDLLVVPSLWPEPFGMVGPEAGLHGLPAAAFAVGGIAEWLIDGVNGFLAPGDCPSSDGLAEAIVKCLRDPALHYRLRRGASQIARRFTIQQHISSLIEVFTEVTNPARMDTPRYPELTTG